MKSLLIVADDLTGAADCAIGFYNHVPCEVLLNPPALLPETPVVALDIDSRNMPIQEAARVHRELLSNPAMAQFPLYKKIDSTLRGHYATEIAALKPRGLAIVAPAYPALGRTTRNGIQHIGGIPVDRSETWRNEGLHGTSDITLALQAKGLRCAQLGRETLMRPVDLRQRILQAIDSKVDALVCDAEVEEDLNLLAAATVDLHEHLYWVGSAGLAKALARSIKPLPLAPTTRPGKPIVTVIGSMASNSHMQAERLISASQAKSIQLDPHWLLDPQKSEERANRSLEFAELVAGGHDLVVRMSQGQRPTHHSRDLSQALAACLQPSLIHTGTLIATGGETARAMLTQAGINQLKLQGEPVPGLVLGEALFRGRALAVVTKAGAFGDPDAFVTTLRYLTDGCAPQQQERPHD
ncbi:four-carbon acid sugar kinase family protein [Pseudomonas monteilii]|uniref:four-carbon acid sugar kinase family protein n=1 Tax=Pseudomonas monteilii TaxID=76759 RepID=UPI003D075532